MLDLWLLQAGAASSVLFEFQPCSLADLPAARAQALHMLGEKAKAEMRDEDTRSQQRMHARP
jgi:hypothetical protein